MNLALFDFDGTITSRDTMLEFARFVRGNAGYLSGMAFLFPKLAAYKFGVYSNVCVKESFLTHFFGGMSARQFRDLAREYSMKEIDWIVIPESRELLDRHKESGDRVVVVSASIDCWVSPWCEKEGFELLATGLEFSNGEVTGRLSTPNCYGPEKVRRIRARLDPGDYERIYAYGDSLGDREMLELSRV